MLVHEGLGFDGLDDWVIFKATDQWNRPLPGIQLKLSQKGQPDIVGATNEKGYYRQEVPNAYTVTATPALTPNLVSMPPTVRYSPLRFVGENVDKAGGGAFWWSPEPTPTPVLMIAPKTKAVIDTDADGFSTRFKDFMPVTAARIYADLIPGDVVRYAPWAAGTQIPAVVETRMTTMVDPLNTTQLIVWSQDANRTGRTVQFSRGVAFDKADTVYRAIEKPRAVEEQKKQEAATPPSEPLPPEQATAPGQKKPAPPPKEEEQDSMKWLLAAGVGAAAVWYFFFRGEPKG